MGRASLADPDMPNKAREGRLCDINRCIGCLQGCDGELEQGLPIRCLVNPLTGKEDEYDLSPVSEPRRVVVVGGGVSGCEAALVAAKRGHKVTLLERELFMLRVSNPVQLNQIKAALKSTYGVK